MARVELLRDHITREAYFRNTATGVGYRRIVGGLAWPDEGRMGCAVVLGELRAKDNTLDARHHVHRLEERRCANADDLVVFAAVLQDEWRTSLWATPITDSRVYIIEDYNDERRKIRRPGLRYGNPFRWAGKGEGLIPYYMALVGRRTVNEKTLILNVPSACADEVGKLALADENRKPTDFPAAAALFFALAEIDGNPMPEWGERREVALGPADPLGGY